MSRLLPEIPQEDVVEGTWKGMARVSLKIGDLKVSQLGQMEDNMNAEFRVHVLNDQGIAKAKAIAESFDRLLDEILAINTNYGPEMALARTKLEEACFYCKKAMAIDPDHWKDPEAERKMIRQHSKRPVPIGTALGVQK
jgi:hypothetical protein